MPGNNKYKNNPGTKNPRSRIIGIEDPVLYSENSNAYRFLLLSQPEIHALLNSVHKRLEMAVGTVLSPPLRVFLKEKKRRKSGDYQSGLSSPQLAAYLQYLASEAKKELAIDLDDRFEQVRFPNMVRLRVLGDIEKALDRGKAAEEQEAVLRTIKETVQKGVAGRLIHFLETGNPSAGRRGSLEEVWAWRRKQNVPWEDHRAFWQLQGHEILRGEIETEGLFREMEILEDLLVENWIRSDEERLLIRQLYDVESAEKLLRMQWTPDDYKKFHKRPSEIRETLLSFVSSPEERKKMEHYLTQALFFYDTARERDRVLLEKTLEKLPAGWTAVLVSGGFHTRGLTDLMKKSGIGYAVIQPRITGTDNQGLYHKVMGGEHADVSPYFNGQPLNKQEALFFKALLETATGTLGKNYGFSAAETGGRVAWAINRHPVLARRVQAVQDSFGERPRLEFAVGFKEGPPEIFQYPLPFEATALAERAVTETFWVYAQRERGYGAGLRGFGAVELIAAENNVIVLPREPASPGRLMTETQKSLPAFADRMLVSDTKRSELRHQRQEAPATRIWNDLRQELLSHDPHLESKWESHAYLPRLYHALKTHLEEIQKKIDEGIIHPHTDLDLYFYREQTFWERLWQNWRRLIRPVLQKVGLAPAQPNRPLRVGFFTTAGNPLNFGHVLVALVAMNRLNLDTVIFRAQGRIEYKFVPQSDKVPPPERHELAERILQRFSPLFLYTDLGLLDNHQGEEALFEFSRQKNPDMPIDFYYIMGSETEQRTVSHRDLLYQKHQQYGGLSEKHGIHWVLMQRGEYGRELTQETAERLMIEGAQKAGVREPFPVHVLRGRDVDLNISSTLYRAGDTSTVPRENEEFARTRGYWGYRPMPDGTILSREQGLELDYQQLSREAADLIGQVMRQKTEQDPMGVFVIDGPSGTGKSTASQQIAAALKHLEEEGYQIVSLGLDLFLMPSDRRSLIEQYVTGEKEDPLGKIKPNERYLDERSFFREEEILGLYREIMDFRRSGEEERIFTVRNPHFRGVKEVPETYVFTLSRKSILLIEGKYAFNYEAPGFYDLRFRIQDDPGRNMALYQKRTRRLNPEEALRKEIFYYLGLQPSYEAYAKATQNLVDFEMNLTRELFELIPKSPEAHYLKSLNRHAPLNREATRKNFDQRIAPHVPADLHEPLYRFLSLDYKHTPPFPAFANQEPLVLKAEDGTEFSFSLFLDIKRSHYLEAKIDVYDITHGKKHVGIFDFSLGWGSTLRADYEHITGGAEYSGHNPALVVIPEYRGRNIGKLLATLAMYLGRLYGYEKFELIDGLVPQLYLDLGFVRAKEKDPALSRNDFIFDLLSQPLPHLRGIAAPRAPRDAVRSELRPDSFKSGTREQFGTRRSELREVSPELIRDPLEQILFPETGIQDIGTRATVRRVEDRIEPYLPKDISLEENGLEISRQATEGIYPTAGAISRLAGIRQDQALALIAAHASGYHPDQRALRLQILKLAENIFGKERARVLFDHAGQPPLLQVPSIINLNQLRDEMNQKAIELALITHPESSFLFYITRPASEALEPVSAELGELAAKIAQRAHPWAGPENKLRQRLRFEVIQAYDVQELRKTILKEVFYGYNRVQPVILAGEDADEFLEGFPKVKNRAGHPLGRVKLKEELTLGEALLLLPAVPLGQQVVDMLTTLENKGYSRENIRTMITNFLKAYHQLSTAA